MNKKQSKVVKILCFLLIFACLQAVLVGCNQPNEAEFLKTAEALLTEAELVNALCFGEGLAYDAENGYTSGGYCEATEESLSAFGVSSVTEIRARIRAVYSVVTAEWVESVALSATYEDSTVLSYSRYYDTVAAEESGNRPVLMVKKNYESLLSGRATYDNLRIVSLKRGRAEILVDVTVTKDGESRVEKDVSLSLRLEEDGWRFDSPTYVSY